MSLNAMRRFLSLLLALSLSSVTTVAVCRMDELPAARSVCHCPHEPAPEASAPDAANPGAMDCCDVELRTVLDAQQPGVATSPAALALDLPVFAGPAGGFTPAAPRPQWLAVWPPPQGPPSASGRHLYLDTARLRL